jgi:hypothetical protein
LSGRFGPSRKIGRMNDHKVLEAVRSVFEAEGIWPDVDESKSMFLRVPHVFAHVVLKDASKYEAAIDAMRRIKLQSRAENERFEWKLRSNWTIQRVEYRGAYYNDEGSLCAASEVNVALASGLRIASLRVPFSHQAGEDLARIAAIAPDDHEALKELKVEKTRRYVEFLLAAGGEMAWDPLWQGGNQLTIDSAALAWVLQEEKRAAFREHP